jgi:hypothetical protein
MCNRSNSHRYLPLLIMVVLGLLPLPDKAT